MAGRILPSAVPASWLRVYEPLGAFGKEDRVFWAAYAFGPDAGADADLVERTVVWRRLLTRGAVLDPVAADAAAALPEPSWSDDDPFAAVTPFPRWDAAPARAVSEGRDVRTHAHVVRVAGGDPLVCPVPSFDRALTQPWRLPLEWLLLAQSDDALTGDLPGRYVVPMARCRTRAARVLRTLRRGLGEVPVAERLASTARWLEAFHPRSAVEIDTRSVTKLVGEDGRDDVQMGLEALAEGDAPTIAAVYRRIQRREQILREISRAS